MALTKEQHNKGWREYSVSRACGHSEQIKVFAPDHNDCLADAFLRECSDCDENAKVIYKIEGGEKHAYKAPQENENWAEAEIPLDAAPEAAPEAPEDTPEE